MSTQTQPPTTANGTPGLDALWAEVRRLGEEVRQLTEAMMSMQTCIESPPPSEWVEVPTHTEEAYAAYLADLDELLAHKAAHPDERFVAYRGRERVGLGTDMFALYQDCLRRFPDGAFNVYGIDAAAKYPNDTVI